MTPPFHMKRKRSLRTYVPCPVCGHQVGIQGAEIPPHRDHRFDLDGLRCPASQQGILDVVTRLNREPA